VKSAPTSTRPVAYIVVSAFTIIAGGIFFFFKFLLAGEASPARLLREHADAVHVPGAGDHDAPAGRREGVRARWSC
jgi:hypothetical protein